MSVGFVHGQKSFDHGPLSVIFSKKSRRQVHDILHGQDEKKHGQGQKMHGQVHSRSHGQDMVSSKNLENFGFSTFQCFQRFHILTLRYPE